jgi:hypothetical protein
MLDSESNKKWRKAMRHLTHIFILGLLMSFSLYADWRAILHDHNRSLPARALLAKVEVLEAHGVAAPTDAVDEALKEDVSWESEHAYLHANALLEVAAQENHIQWPTPQKQSFDEEAFRAEVLAHPKLKSNEATKIDGASAVAILQREEDRRSAFAVVKKRPLEAGIYKFAQALGLGEVVVPHIELGDGSGRTAEVFQKAVAPDDLLAIPMRSLLFVEQLQDDFGGLTLMRVNDQTLNKQPLLAHYHPYFLEGLCKEDVDKLYLLWALTGTTDMTLRNFMVVCDPAGFHLKAIDTNASFVQGLNPSEFLQQHQVKGKGFGAEVVELFKRWETMSTGERTAAFDYVRLHIFKRDRDAIFTEQTNAKKQAVARQRIPPRRWGGLSEAEERLTQLTEEDILKEAEDGAHNLVRAEEQKFHDLVRLLGERGAAWAQNDDIRTLIGDWGVIEKDLAVVKGYREQLSETLADQLRSRLSQEILPKDSLDLVAKEAHGFNAYSLALWPFLIERTGMHNRSKPLAQLRAYCMRMLLWPLNLNKGSEAL